VADAESLLAAGEYKLPVMILNHGLFQLQFSGDVV
jgi:hypothetical protein